MEQNKLLTDKKESLNSDLTDVLSTVELMQAYLKDKDNLGDAEICMLQSSLICVINKMSVLIEGLA